MPSPKKAAPKGPKPNQDPAKVHNARILAERQGRIDALKAKTQPAVDKLGLGLVHKKPTNATEFLFDEFDKKTFGQPRYTTRILYGPDPLLQMPLFKQRIDELGLEAFAQIVKDLITDKQEMAFDDKELRIGLRGSIREFGVEAVAEAFAGRIMRIPSRSVNIEVDTGDDDEVLGKPLEDAVRRYGNPGMSPFWMSPRCITLLGKRGYQTVMNEHGDPVQVGTLILHEIPIGIARRRRQKCVDESNENIEKADENYLAAEERFKSAMVGAPARSTQGVGFLPGGQMHEGHDSDNNEPIKTGLTIETEKEALA